MRFAARSLKVIFAMCAPISLRTTDLYEYYFDSFNYTTMFRHFMNSSPHLFEWLRQKLLAELESLQRAGELPAELDFDAISVQAPRERSHGDLATNAAMLLANGAGKPPMEIAESIAKAMEGDPDLAGVSTAPPGFVNFTLTQQRIVAALGEILLAGENYGANALGKGGKVNVEYVSANPTGPLHIGHVRGAVFGDALANLLQWSGFEVCREYYINDAGLQVDILARSAFLRYRQALGEDIGTIPGDMYPGEYLCAVGEKLAQTHGKTLLEKEETVWLPIARATAIEEMMANIREDLRLLGIEQEYFASEQKIISQGGVERVLQRLKSEGLLYEGVLEPPKGKSDIDWQPREQLLFRSTDFGDATDRALTKADGSWTYFVNDIAYHFNKFERGYKDMIDIWGADHGGYVKRQFAAVAAITGGKGRLDVKICQLVRLLRQGKVMKMSKRLGEFVTLRELAQEAGRDATRFMMLYRRNDAVLDFDFSKVMEKSRDNPVFYVQYAHARACSALRVAYETPGLQAEDLSVSGLARRRFKSLTHVGELDLIKRMAAFPHMVENSAKAHEPHRIAFYLYDLASAFHILWSEGKKDPSLRFIAPERNNTSMDRIGLIRAFVTVIANGLAILGVTAPEEMR